MKVVRIDFHDFYRIINILSIRPYVMVESCGIELIVWVGKLVKVEDSVVAETHMPQ